MSTSLQCPLHSASNAWQAAANANVSTLMELRLRDELLSLKWSWRTWSGAPTIEDEMCPSPYTQPGLRMLNEMGLSVSSDSYSIRPSTNAHSAILHQGLLRLLLCFPFTLRCQRRQKVGTDVHKPIRLHFLRGNLQIGNTLAMSMLLSAPT